MGSVKIISKNSISAANHIEPNCRIELSPWDARFLLLDYSQRGLVFYKPNQSQWENTSSLIHHLKTCLSRTLDFFPPFAGRLATIDYGNDLISYFIDCNNAGAEFVHAVAYEVSVADIVEPTYVPEIVHSFFTLNGTKDFEGTSKSLLGLQVTELKDGIFIGCTANHSVVDGSSAWHFLNSWSEICRSAGSCSISKPPIFQRLFPYDIDYPVRIPKLKEQTLSNSLVLQPLQLQQRVFHFSGENIAKLKAKANAEIGTNSISSLQAVIAHLCRSAVRNQCLDDPNRDDDQEVTCRFGVGIRGRVQPPLPQEYFGNAIQIGNVTFKARELVEQGLGHVAWKINMVIAMYTGEKVKEFVENWEKNPQLVIRPAVTASNAFTIANSPKFDVYGNDFGWGKPIAARSGPHSKKNGRITLFAGVEKGSMDLEVCLSTETLQAMGNDAEFMDAVTV